MTLNFLIGKIRINLPDEVPHKIKGNPRLPLRCGDFSIVFFRVFKLIYFHWHTGGDQDEIFGNGKQIPMKPWFRPRILELFKIKNTSYGLSFCFYPI